MLLYLCDQLNKYEYPEIQEAIYKPLTTEQKIRRAFPNHAGTMVAVAKCESGLRQFDSTGKVIRSHTNDFGLLQINEKTWDSKAKELGLDYKGNLNDNIKMAQYVYRVQGVNAWVCHSKMVASYTIN